MKQLILNALGKRKLPVTPRKEALVSVGVSFKEQPDGALKVTLISTHWIAKQGPPPVTTVRTEGDASVISEWITQALKTTPKSRPAR